MFAVQKLLKTTQAYLKSSPVFSSFPMSVLTIGLEKLMEMDLSCPCKWWNAILILLVFIAPALFLWSLMCCLLAPFRYCSENECKCCSKCSNEEKPSENKGYNKKLCFKAFAHSLTPSIMWIIFLFLDGDYLACSHTAWEGDFVFDEKLNRKLCVPFELANATQKNDLHQRYQKMVSISQIIGYSMLGLFAFLIIKYFVTCYIETKETGVQTERVETVMADQGQGETCVQIDHTQDLQGTTGDVQTGAHSSAQDPHGKVEDDIDESESLVGGR